jgi:hypothetical protein
MTKNFWFLAVACAAMACTKAPQSTELQTTGQGVIGGELLTEPLQRAATVGVFMSGGYCSGSYIGNNTVITASHCIHDGPANHVKFNHPQGVFACNVIKNIEHPDYARDQVPWFDIAVLKINCTDSRINQIVPYVYNTDSRLPDDVFSAGYGLSSQDGGYNFPLLSFMKLEPFDMNIALEDPTIDAEMKAGDRLPELIASVNEGRLLCYKSTIEHTVFFGDSGGPHYSYTADGKYLLLGVNDVLYTKNEDVASLYSFCAASVAYYKNWVDAQ